MQDGLAETVYFKVLVSMTEVPALAPEGGGFLGSREEVMPWAGEGAREDRDRLPAHPPPGGLAVGYPDSPHPALT